MVRGATATCLRRDKSKAWFGLSRWKFCFPCSIPTPCVGMQLSGWYGTKIDIFRVWHNPSHVDIGISRLIVPMYHFRLPITHSGMTWHILFSSNGNWNSHMMTIYHYTEHLSLYSHYGLWGQEMRRTVWCETNCSSLFIGTLWERLDIVVHTADTLMDCWFWIKVWPDPFFSNDDRKMMTISHYTMSSLVYRLWGQEVIRTVWCETNYLSRSLFVLLTPHSL